MSIHVNPSLDQDQRICRPVSFYDLVELMTYARLFLNQSARVRLASLRSPKKKKKLAYDKSTSSVVRPLDHSLIDSTTASASVVYQTWTMLDDEHAINWRCDDPSAPLIHVFSTINSLAQSLVVSDDMEVFIDRPPGLVGGPEPWRSTRTTATPVFDEHTLAVTLLPRDRTAGVDQTTMPRLSVDLKTLLSSVVVSPKAPPRFFDLVSDLVQRISYAGVSRAHSLMESGALRTAYSRRA